MPASPPSPCAASSWVVAEVFVVRFEGGERSSGSGCGSCLITNVLHICDRWKMLCSLFFFGASHRQGQFIRATPASQRPRPVACEGVALITSLARAAGRYHDAELSWVELSPSSESQGHIYLTCKSQIHPSSFCAVWLTCLLQANSTPLPSPALLGPLFLLFLSPSSSPFDWHLTWTLTSFVVGDVESDKFIVLALPRRRPPPLPLSLLFSPNKHALCWDYAQPSLARRLRGALCRTHFVRNLFCLLYFSFFSSLLLAFVSPRTRVGPSWEGSSTSARLVCVNLYRTVYVCVCVCVFCECVSSLLCWNMLAIWVKT